MESSNLKQLSELTRKLTLADLIDNEHRDTIRYRTLKGQCVGTALLSEDLIAIQKTFMSKDTALPIHVHNKEIEILVVYAGELRVNNTSLTVGGLVKLLPGEEHLVSALEDSWLIGITIPADKAYPGVKS